MIPSEADERAETERILRQQPDLSPMIETAQANAREMFANPRFSLDTHGYDDWNPPLQLIAHAEMERIPYQKWLIRFKQWLVEALRYDSDRILISAQRILDKASA